MKSPEVTLVLVEDDDLDAVAVERGLEQAKIGNPLVRVRDGIEALELLLGSPAKERLKPPYLLLIDIRMPRLDGLGLLRAIRNNPQLKRTIAFILTTSDSERDLMAAYEAHVAGYIVKDGTSNQFAKLAGMLDYYIMIVAPPPALLAAAGGAA